MRAPQYLCINEGGALPHIKSYAPFRAVIIIEDGFSSEWQAEVARWLVTSGCLYALTWGIKCAEWHDAIDWAQLESDKYFSDIPEDRRVLTTWHENEPLEEVFWFAENAAYHPVIGLQASLIVDISPAERGQEMLSKWSSAQCS